jgi:CHAT domain-containing protein
VLRQEVKDRKPAAKTVVVLADAVFAGNDKRVTEMRSAAAPDNPLPVSSRGIGRELLLGLERAAEESGVRGGNLPRLPGTRVEAMQIISLVSKGEGMEALDFAASRQTATSGELSQYRYVHFATHGFLNSLHPELSGIALSMFDERGNPQDGFLRAHEVFNLKLSAELVVLSACQTGLGKEVKGEGLVSLTRGFMYAGAPRVVVSLWSVNDLATAELMGRFYRGMLNDKLRPAAALRAAQVSLMKEKGWQSPFYWAAFTLQGEWR